MRKFVDILQNINWFLISQLGLDIKKFIYSFRGLYLYIQDLAAFRKIYKGEFLFKPCLHDKFEENSAIQNEYFWQDLFVSREIHECNPGKHVDIGSRVDGFVAHVASFREIDVFDVRPNTTIIPGIVFHQADITNDIEIQEFIELYPEGYCDSLSCLHAIEHFGLGRYGDRLLVDGLESGIKNIAALLKAKGRLYLSTPIGSERVEFNANWVFDPARIVEVAEHNNMKPESLFIIDNKIGPMRVGHDRESLVSLAADTYHLGIFIFRKTAQA